MQLQKSFLIQLLGLTLISEFAVMVWMFAMPALYITPTLWGMPLFFMLITLLIHRSFIGALELNPRQFVTRYMLITTVKLLSFLAILFVYVLVFRDDALNFVISFFLFYIIFAGFEAVSVIKLNNSANK